MKKLLIYSVTCMCTLLLLTEGARAETVKGSIKLMAPEDRLFSLADRQNVLLISWDSATDWQGFSNPPLLRIDETVTVVYRASGDQLAAVSVARIPTPLPAGIKTVTVADLAGSAGLPAGTKPTLVDTRPTEAYDAGHIPGAISVPLARLEKKARGLIPENRLAPLVFYDEGQGGVSAGRGAELAAAMGYADVAILPEGSAGWSDSGRALAVTATFIRKTRPALIDLCPAEQSSGEHIEGAVNFPATRFRAYRDRVRIDRLAPIVVYGDSDQEAAAAVKTMKEWGFRNVCYYPGGAAAWANSAEILKKGAAPDKELTPAGHGGRLTPDNFKLALISPATVELVDVRATATHSFPRAVKIPLRELAARHGELNRGKIQVLFAENLTRAEMAFDFLKSKGYRVNYLDGGVEFDSAGQHSFK